MKTCSTVLNQWFFTFCLLLVVGLCSCQDESQQTEKDGETGNPYEWITKSYSFPSLELIRGFASRDRGELRHPSLPSAEATEAQILDFVKKSNSITTHYLDIQGMSLPEGTVMVFDPSSFTLTARAPRLIHGSIQFLAESFQDGADKYLVLESSVIEATNDAVQNLVAQASQIADHTALKEEIEASPGSHTVFYGKSESRSGHRTKIADLKEVVFPNDFYLHSENLVDFSSESESWGISFELDPIIGADEFTIDLNFQARLDYRAPSFRHQVVNQIDKTQITIPTIERSYAETTTAFTLHSGFTKLAGVWAADAGENQEADSKLVAFVQAFAVKNLPVLEERLVQMMEQHADTVEEIPEGKLHFRNQPEEIPDGMIVRRYVVPPTFLSIERDHGSGGPAADPFAAPIDSEPRFTMRATAKDILMSAGIAFPEGSSANYLAGSSTLVIRNIPENIELVEAFIDSIVTRMESTISVEAHVIEGPEDLLRSVAQETRLLSNHEKQWQALKKSDAVTQVETIFLEGRSGQRAKTMWGKNYAFPVSSKMDKRTEKKEEGNQENATSGSFGFSPTVEERFVGTTLEFDAVLGADSRSVDLNFSLLKDQNTPSTELKFSNIDAEQSVRLDGPITRFEQTKFSSNALFRHGAIRMVSLARPEGAGDKAQALFLRINVLHLGEENN